MPNLRPAALLVLCLIVGLSAACGGNNNSPTTPSATLTTETFTGTFPQGGSAAHAFVVQQSGNVTVTIVSLSPVSSVVVGIGIGQSPDNTTCSLLAVNETMTTGRSASGGFQADVYCVAIYDVGTLAAGDTVSYVLNVVHP